MAAAIRVGIAFNSPTDPDRSSYPSLVVKASSGMRGAWVNQLVSGLDLTRDVSMAWFLLAI